MTAMKTFTLEQANALIPQVEQLLDEMTHVRDQIVASGASLESVLRRASGNGGNKTSSEYILLLQRFNACLSTLQEFGIELKDLDQGLVDFPSYRGDQLIYLCWKRGEDRVRFWHDLESGFAGRQPL
ncbi:MAG: DUF2203 domain-containing protein [Chloroflexi bacterium]|nr:DUF2203 domain-containing protein [Chloroflexota bacterium]